LGGAPAVADGEEVEAGETLGAWVPGGVAEEGEVGASLGGATRFALRVFPSLRSGLFWGAELCFASEAEVDGAIFDGDHLGGEGALAELLRFVRRCLPADVVHQVEGGDALDEVRGNGARGAGREGLRQEAAGLGLAKPREVLIPGLRAPVGGQLLVAREVAGVGAEDEAVFGVQLGPGPLGGQSGGVALRFGKRLPLCQRF